MELVEEFAVAETLVGCPGVVAGMYVVEPSTQLELPPLFVARTCIRYFVPFVSPVRVIVVDESEVDALHDLGVTSRLD